MDVGFNSPAAFARAFRERFGMSASDWRVSEDRKIGKAIGKDGNAACSVQMHFEAGAWAPKWRLVMDTTTTKINVEVRDLPKRTVAYVRHTGAYQGNSALFAELFGKLAQWAGAHGLLGPGAQFMSLYHDDPAVTDDKNLRVMCGCVVPSQTEVGGEIGKTIVAAGTYGVGHFELSESAYSEAWAAMYGGWLPIPSTSTS